MATRYKVQKLVTLKARGTANVGRVWETIGKREGFRSKAVAEHVQQNAMIDVDTEVRIVPVTAPARREKAVW